LVVAEESAGIPQDGHVAEYLVNPDAVAYAEKLIPEWRHKQVELAAHDLLQLLDGMSA
jgi:hypothetical protein